MGHERVDFPSTIDLTRKLQWKLYSDPARVALSPDGTLVCLDVDRNPAGNSLNIDIEMLTVNGAKPSLDVLRPFLKGSVKTEPNNEG
jgi:hypothetical protein